MPIEDAWWVLAPRGHREHDNAEKRAWLAEPAEDGVEKIAMGPDLPVDLWVCDWCNADIPIDMPEGEEYWVPMLLSNALCPQCVSKVLHKNPEAMAAYEDGKSMLVWWSPNGCGCPACHARALEIRKKMETIYGG